MSVFSKLDKSTKDISKTKKTAKENKTFAKLPDGNYRARFFEWTEKSDKEKGDSVRFQFVVEHEDKALDKKRFSKFYDFKDHPKFSAEEKKAAFLIDIETLGGDVDSIESFSDLKQILDNLCKSLPLADVAIVTNKNNANYQNYYINGVHESEMDDSNSEDENEETNEDDNFFDEVDENLEKENNQTNEASNDDDDFFDDDNNELGIPEVGQQVQSIDGSKAAGPFEIVSVDEDAETVTIKNSDGKKKNKVSWSKLVFDDTPF
tara:strand:+ start:10754 stop:11542 length:789 start_codon:yes stop_codon:yes gene_type:complete